jgi:endonuclease G, mitochondrial
MLNLSPDDRKQLRLALTSSFRQYSSLKIFVSDNFEQPRLTDIAGSDSGTIFAADRLITDFDERGDLSALILALYKERPRNPEVQYLAGRLKGFLQQRLVLDPTERDLSVDPGDFPFELPEPYGDYSDLQLESFLPRPLSYEADLGQLCQGLKLAAEAVCKVSFSDRPATGTGVLIAPDLVLTNYHILSKQPISADVLNDKARTLLFEFDFVSEEQAIPVAPECFAIASTQPIVACSPPIELDYVLLRLEPKMLNSRYRPIQPKAMSLKSRDSLSVVHHPDGEVMQVSLSTSGVVQASEKYSRVWYVNKTQAGSSGSPCFNRDWELVALHHAAMSRGFGSIREGILLSAILAEISGFLKVGSNKWDVG